MNPTDDIFSDLRNHVQKLGRLLDDPHPGLATWVIFYSEHMEAISGYWMASEKSMRERLKKGGKKN